MKQITTTSLEKKWESKDRSYTLVGKTPLTYKIRSKGLLYFDEEAGVNRELRYATNQRSIFVEDQDDNATLGHVMFEDGHLFVPKNNPNLQKLLSLYHPQKEKWSELDEQKDAVDEIEVIEFELKALGLVGSLDIEHLEAIMRTELGSTVTSISSKELKRDAYHFAKSNPKLFIELSEDEDLKLRNLANRAVEAGILKLTEDGTVFALVSNGKKVLTVPFDTHPYSALSQYFKTDEGVTLMKSIIKKIS